MLWSNSTPPHDRNNAKVLAHAQKSKTSTASAPVVVAPSADAAAASYDALRATQYIIAKKSKATHTKHTRKHTPDLGTRTQDLLKRVAYIKQL